jgi:anti-sigma-K factor RskA
MNTIPPSQSPADLLAAEYVLGVLDADTRRAVERRAAREPELATAIAAWQGRLAPLAGDIAPVEPPRHVWERVLSATNTRPSLGGVRLNDRVGFLDSLAFWRWIGGGALVAAACLLVVLLQSGRPATPAPRGYMVSTITAADGQSGYVATVDLANARVVLVPIAANASSGRVPELWMIAPGEKPLSLGVVAADRPTTISLSPSLVKKMGPDDLLAVSLEPPGGSPTGQPTGPVVAKGQISGT